MQPQPVRPHLTLKITPLLCCFIRLSQDGALHWHGEGQGKPSSVCHCKCRYRMQLLYCVSGGLVRTGLVFYVIVCVHVCMHVFRICCY